MKPEASFNNTNVMLNEVDYRISVENRNPSNPRTEANMAQQPLFPPYYPPTPAATAKFQPRSGDFIAVCCLTVLAYLAWEWHVIIFPAGVGTSVFLLGCIGVSFGYLSWLKIKQTRASWVMAGLALISALRFTLMDARDIEFFFYLVSISLCLLWVAYTCRTNAVQGFSGYIAADLVNQIMIVPITNYGRWFQSLAWPIRSQRFKLKTVGIVVLSCLICIPIFALVLNLLASADIAFERSLHWLWKLDFLDEIVLHGLQLIAATLVAAYIFAVLCGNARRYYTDSLTEQKTNSLITASHKIAVVAIYTPLILLNMIYFFFFISMGSYLFSAVAGNLPGGFTYAEYARRGFFELCGVAFINLFALGFAYLFAKREPKQYPRALRVLGITISGFTLLLIVTALSKLLLYIDTYGFSRLRLYALWFLLLLGAVFIILLIWQLRPFDAGRPIALVCAVACLGLGFANTDGFIADYNVDRYLNAGVSMDVSQLQELNDAAIPALKNLVENAEDSIVSFQAQSALKTVLEKGEFHQFDKTQFPDWNLQSVLNR